MTRPSKRFVLVIGNSTGVDAWLARGCCDTLGEHERHWRVRPASSAPPRV